MHMNNSRAPTLLVSKKLYNRTERGQISIYNLVHEYISARTNSARFKSAVLLYCTYTSALLKSSNLYGYNLLFLGKFRVFRTNVLGISS